MPCPICGREAVEESFCKYHKEASDNILKKYVHWKRATGISWKGYLSQIAKNPLSGAWTKEVAQYLIKLEEKNNVKIS